MNAKGVCVQVEHSTFGGFKCSGLKMNDIVITHGMILASISLGNGNYKDPIKNFNVIMKDILSLQSSNYPKDEAHVPIKFKVLSQDCSHPITTNKFGITHKLCKPNMCSEYVVEEARVCSIYTYREFSDIANEISNWNDSNNDHGCNSQTLFHELLPVFIILMVHRSEQPVIFEEKLFTEYSLIKYNDLYPGLPLIIDSTPLGNFSLANSWCQGIVSKIIGKENDGFLTDARLVAGCEGAPIFRFEDGVKGPLVGIVIQTPLWCQGEWVAFSLGLSIKHLLKSILSLQSVTDCIPFSKTNLNISDTPVNMNDLSEAVVFVRCLHKWGSGVVVDAPSGLILTCSHILNHAYNSVQVLCKHGMVAAKVVYASTAIGPYDLALISVGSGRGLKQLEFADTPPILGEKVLTVGYPLSSESQVTANRTPTLTTGCVAKVSRRGGPVHTTCSTHNGTSGGALLRPPNVLLGIVVGNILIEGTLISSFSVVVSVKNFGAPICDYLASGDPSCLESLHVDDRVVEIEWELPDCRL